MVKNNQDLITESKENYLESILKLSLKCNIERFDDDTDKDIFHNEAINALIELNKDENVTLNSEVHAINIRDDLNYSKPSVSIMLHNLENEGFITIDNDNHIHLTDVGYQIAKKTYERHLILSDILVQFGVNINMALEDACKLEHDLQDETFNKIKNYYLNKYCIVNP